MNNRIYELEEPYEIESKNIYFDEENGYLLRLLRCDETPVLVLLTNSAL